MDTLGRWMAHHVAELIQAADTASGDDRVKKMQACREAILDLWSHRHELPDGTRPFERCEPVLRALESLDPEGTPRYYRAVKAPRDQAESEGEGLALHDLVEGLDYSAKVLMRYFIAEEARVGLGDAVEWLALSAAADCEPGIVEPSVVGVLLEESNLQSGEPQNAEGLRRLEDRLARLEGFVALASVLVADLRPMVEAARRTAGDTEQSVS